MPDSLKNLDLNWCGDETTNLKASYKSLGVSQFDFVDKLQDAVIKMRELQINNYKDRIKNRVSEEDFNKLNQAGIFDTKNMALSNNYIACGTDFHGDIFSLYAFLVQCGYLIPNKNKTLITNFVTGEIIYDGNSPIDQKTLDNIINSDANRNKELVLLPGFDINPNFKGKIKLLGDYIDRGKESPMCLALLDYLTQQKNYNEYLDVHIGNHETFATDGLYCAVELYKLYKIAPGFFGDFSAFSDCGDNFKRAIDRMIEKRQMTLGSLEKLPNGKYMSYAHTCLCKKHVPKMLAALVKFSQLEDFLKQPHPDINQEYLDVYKTHLNKYKKLMTDPRYSDLASKINKINFNGQNELLNINNFQDTCDYLQDKSIGFEEKDYFILKNFIGEIVGNFDNQDRQIGKSIIRFYGDIFSALNDKQGGLWPWTMADRYRPSLNEMFETVYQTKGHDYTETLNPFTIEQNNQKQSNITDIDTKRSSGYQKKKSDSVVVIECPSDKDDLKDLFLIEKYSSKRKFGDYFVTTDISQEETFVSHDEFGSSKIKKKSDINKDKEFKSLKKYFGAYSKSYLISENKFELCEAVLGKNKFAMDKEIQVAKAEKEATEKAEREKKEKAEQEAKAKAEKEAKEAQEKAEQEAKAKAEKEAKEAQEKAEQEAKAKAEKEAKEAQEKAEREEKEQQNSLSDFSDSAEKGDVDKALEIIRDKKQDKDFDSKLKKSVLDDLTLIKRKIEIKDIGALDDDFLTKTKNKLIVYSYFLHPNKKKQNEKLKKKLESADKVSLIKIILTVIGNILVFDFKAVFNPQKTRIRERLKDGMRSIPDLEKLNPKEIIKT